MKNLMCAMITVGAVFFLTNVHADESQDILVSKAWVRAMPSSQTTSAAYMSIQNRSSNEAVIVSASSDIAGATEIHQMSEMNGMMNMAMASNLHIPAEGTVVLKPGGFHIMLINLKKPLNEGDVVPITLHFQDGTSIMVDAHVQDQ